MHWMCFVKMQHFTSLLFVSELAEQNANNFNLLIVSVEVEATVNYSPVV